MKTMKNEKTIQTMEVWKLLQNTGNMEISKISESIGNHENYANTVNI